MRRLVCAFVVHKPPKTGFRATRPIYEYKCCNVLHLCCQLLHVLDLISAHVLSYMHQVLCNFIIIKDSSYVLKKCGIWSASFIRWQWWCQLILINTVFKFISHVHSALIMSDKVFQIYQIKCACIYVIICDLKQVVGTKWVPAYQMLEPTVPYTLFISPLLTRSQLHRSQLQVN